jgi:hypothetical protein
MEGRAGWEVVTRLSDFTKATTRKSNEIYSGPPRYIARIDSEMQQPFGTSILRVAFKYRTHVGDIERRDCFR